MIDPRTIATNAGNLLDAIGAWMTSGDSTELLAVCATVRAANDPADPVSRAETELAVAAERAVMLGDMTAIGDLHDALQISNRVMADANAAAFERWLNTMDPTRLTGREIDTAAKIARDLNAAGG